MPLSTIRGFLLGVIALALALPAQAQHQLDEPNWRITPADVDWLSAASTVRGGVVNPATGNLLIASREGAVSVQVVNPATGAVTGQLNVTDVAGGTFAINKIAATADGQIFASNLVTDASASPFKIYWWEDETSAPTVVYQGAPSAHRYGDSFNVSGSGADVEAFASGSGNANLAIFEMAEGAFGTPSILALPGAGTAQTGIVRAAGQDSLWINGPNTLPAQKISMVTGEVGTVIPGELAHLRYSELAEFMVEGRTYLAVGPGLIHDGVTPNIRAGSVTILDVTYLDDIQVVAQTHQIGTADNRFAPGGFVTYDAANGLLIAGVTQNPIEAFSLGFLLPEVLAAAWSIEAGDVDWFENDNATRGAGYNPATDNVVLVSRTGGLNMRILHAGTGEELGTMNVTDVAGGTFPLSEIAITDDGQIFGANLTTNPESSPVRIYRWRNERAAPELVFSGALPGPRYGDGIGVYGSGNEVDLYISGSGNDQIVRFAWDGEELTQVAVLRPEEGAPRGRFGLEPISSDRMWINSAGHVLALIDTETGEIVREVLDSPRTTASGYLTSFSLDGRDYIATGPQFGIEEGFVVVDVTDPGSAVVSSLTGVLGPNANGNGAGAAAWDSRRNNLVVLGTNNAVASFSLAEPAEDAAPTAPLITSPADGAGVTIEGNELTEFVISWTAARDPQGTEFAYAWELTADPDAEEPLLAVDAGDDTSIVLTYAEVDALLAAAGLAVGESVELFHRAVASDNGTVIEGPYARATLTRGQTVSTGPEPEAIAFSVGGNFPNPFTASTTLRYDLPVAAEVRVEVYDVLGRRILVTPTSTVSAGAGQAVVIDAAGLAAGTYLWRLTADTASETFSQTGRMTLMR